MSVLLGSSVGRPVRIDDFCITNVLDGSLAKMDADIEGISPMPTALACPADIELRLVDRARNRLRLYGITECRTLFGELCLRVQWGRIGHRRLRERSETFSDARALEQRRRELLGRRRRHGYVPVQPTTAAVERRVPGTPVRTSRHRGSARLVASGASRPRVDRTLARSEATSALARYLEERQPERLDLVDVSTLAAMYVDAVAS